MIDEAYELWEQVGGAHFQTLLDGLAARVAAGEGDLERAERSARTAWEHVRDTDGTGHPFPIRTMADCVMALEPCPDTDDLVAEVLAFARQLVKRVPASITDPAYRQTYLTLPEVRYVLG